MRERVWKLIDAFRHPALARGTMYIIETPGQPYYKIGSTKHDVEVRMKQLSTASPVDFAIVAEFPGGRSLEELFHRIFAEQHERSDWFRAEGELAEFIRSVRARAGIGAEVTA